MACVLLGLGVFSQAAAADKLYVVERERGRLAVVEEGRLSREIPGLGNLNHATVKFLKGFAYVISRDGRLSRVDLSQDRVVETARVGESGIGLTFVGDAVAVANYDPPSVVVVDQQLKPLTTIETGSRNVGIQSRGNLLVFSLMDKDQVWVADANQDFQVVSRVPVGQMPFDAMLAGHSYLIGFFEDASIGVLDLESGSYRTHDLTPGGETLLKIPHFGLWGKASQAVYVPGVKQRCLHVLDLPDLTYRARVELQGNPVFAVVAPGGQFLAVNYSGDREDFVSIVDLRTLQIVRELEAGRRVMHLRFSADGERLYLTSYRDNKLKIFETRGWSLTETVDVPGPSGIFLVPAE
ncbi:MAG: NirF protein [Armatimonadetes bacterium]|nr:NirF protein [Armatimonadota bacterium]